MRRSRILTYRYEPFGGILHLSRPAALVWVDKDYMRSLGYADSPLWDLNTRLLSAPTEVHASVTHQCSAGCPGCYVDSFLPGTRPDASAREVGLAGMKRVVDALAEARVFHIALGGGESLEMHWIFELAAYARSRGIVPNLTTNGLCVDERTARRCRVFGQINVSVDGIDEGYARSRGVEGFGAADRSMRLLRKAGCNVGINAVVSRRSFDQLEGIIRYARRSRVNQVELLRFKPVGRGREIFPEMDLTEEQALAFYPRVAALARRHRVRLRLDCSFMPMVYAHGPDVRRLDLFAILGCHGGELLMGVGPDGAAHACSFAPPEPWVAVEKGPGGWSAEAFRAWWRSDAAFAPFRSWTRTAPAPCDTCAYLEPCRGGCHAVALASAGRLSAPDPGCPIVSGRSRPIETGEARAWPAR